MTTEPAAPRDHSKQRVVLTGGPAAGKTAVAEVLKRQLSDEVAVVPEVATMLFQAGFPRPKVQAGRCLVQQTIFSVQHNIEGLFEITHPDVTHVCDRGTLDGAAFWPGGTARFLNAMGTTAEAEFRRYDAVVFLQTSAHGENTYSTDSPVRTETPAQARVIDERLQKVWSEHPNFHLVTHESNFYEKVAAVLIALHRALGLGSGSPVPADGRAARRGKKR